MTVAELLRQLADKLDTIDSPDAAVLSPNNAEPSDEPTMMTPNQQKLELLKKGVGVDSQYDDESACGSDDNELNDIRKMAGVNPAVVHIASDDDPLE